MSATRIRSHWYAKRPAAAESIRAAAQRAADYSGNTQRIHNHPLDLPCPRKGCKTIRPRARR